MSTEIKNSKNFILLFVICILTSLLFGLVGGFLGTFLPLMKVTSSSGQIVKSDAKLVNEQKNIQVVEDSATIDVVKKVSPSVVSIIISKDISKYYNQSGVNVLPFDNFFDLGLPFDFKLNNGSNNPKENQDQNKEENKKQIGGGSGFIITEDGMILTNKHVVSDSEAEYTVVTNDGKKYSAKVLAQDPVNDLAVIKIDAKGLAALELGDSGSLQIGETVIAIGNTLGEYKNTVTKGVVSGINRVVSASDGNGNTEQIQEAIQTDAAINPGNSGGPLLNLAGQVVGINTAVSSSGQSIGFALPINVAKKSVESVKKFGKIIRPWLGIRYIMVTEELKKKNNLTIDYGALIIGDANKQELGVIADSPAQKAGLADGDVILQINGEKIETGHLLSNVIAKYAPGDEITLKVLSKGEQKDIKVKLEEYKEKTK